MITEGSENSEVKSYTIRICDACMRLDGGMCHVPECVFCRRTMEEVRVILEALTLRCDAISYVAPSDTSRDWQALVRAWHAKFGVLIGDSPAIRRPELRAALIEEEARETCDAILRGDLVEAIDGMCDVAYVICGTAVEFGIDLAPFFAEVHRTNMEKEGGSTRADGKILKPEGWKPPRIAELLAEAMAESAQ